MFSPPAYISIGDEFDKCRGSNKLEKIGAKSFVVQARRHPHLLDSTFSPFVSLSNGVPYRSTSAFAQGTKESINVNADSNTNTNTITNNNNNDGDCNTKIDLPPFKPPGASHKSSGKGDYYGTFCEKNIPKHESELPFISNGAEVKLSTLIKPRNFYTNPPKKGTYGFPGLTIGKRGEIQYMSDPYGGMPSSQINFNDKTKTNSNNNMETSNNINNNNNNYSTRVGPPFKAAVKSGRCFDESEHGFSQVYSLSKPLIPKNDASITNACTSSERTADELEKAISRKPWVPGGALVKEITKTYEYVEDPLDWKERNRRTLRQQEMQYKPWHPVGTDRYRYIYTKPIAYDPPAILEVKDDFVISLKM